MGEGTRCVMCVHACGVYMLCVGRGGFHTIRTIRRLQSFHQEEDLEIVKRKNSFMVTLLRLHFIIYSQ